MGIAVGYVTMFDLVAVVNGTTRRATTYTGDGTIAKARVITLPNGTKVNYDGTSDSPTTLGRVTQEFLDTAGSAYMTSLHNKLGNVGLLVLTDAADDPTTYLSASAILIKVQDTTPVQGARDKVWCTATWEIVGAWA